MLDREIGFTGPEPQNSAPMPAARAQGTIYHGGVLVKSGDVAEGLSLVRRGSEAFSATGARMLVPYHMALLAMASEIAGQIDEAMEALNDALQMVERTGERWLVAELCRRKGQLLVRQGQAGAAEELYRKSLSVAEEQGGQAVETARRDEPCAALTRLGQLGRILRLRVAEKLVVGVLGSKVRC